MRQAIPFRKLCAYPGCTGAKWEQRGLEICGGHAREVLAAMKPEVQQQEQRTVDERIRRLEAVAKDQHETIRRLRGEIPEPEPRKPRTHGTIYYVRSGGFIKVGWTSDLAKRMRAYSPDSVLLATEPGTRKDENRRHRMFAAHRTHGREWYAMVPSLMHHIETIVKEHGQPDAVSFAAKPVGIPQPRPKQYVGGNYRGLGLVGNGRP